MDAHLNRAGLTRRHQWLAIVVAGCISGTSAAAHDATKPGKPQRISATTIPAANRTHRDPSLVIHEPVDVPTAGSETAGLLARRNAAIGSSSLPNRLVSNRLSDGLSDPLTQAARSTSSLLVEQDRLIAMPGFSTASIRQAAASLLDESAARLSHHASYSAAAAATESLRMIAQSSDAIQGGSRRSTDLISAMVAIREAEDFVGRYGFVDSTAIARMVRSHQTTVLKDASTSHLTGLVAADIYLDSARRMLSLIAAEDPLAATAIGLLAQSYRQRNSESTLALPTAVHLMRAAVSASPHDRGLTVELASVLEQAKLHEEAQLVLAAVSRLPSTKSLPSDASDAEPVIAVVSGTQSNRPPSEEQQVVRIEQLSPAAFATVSRAEAGPVSTARSTTPSAALPADASKGKHSAVSRTFKSMTRMWR